MSSNVKRPENFCSAPWVHLNLEPDGNVLGCCIYRGSYGSLKEQSIEELMNNENVREIRRKFLNNEKPDQCKTCWDQEDLEIHSLRGTMNNYYEDKFVTDTKEDGTYEDIKLRYWDMRPNNTCNLGCHICSPALSSGVGRLQNELNVGYHRKLHKNPIFKDDNWEQNLAYLKTHLPHVQDVYFAGGEPLIIPEHVDMLNMISEHRPDVRLRYNTNLTTLVYKGIDFLDVWKKHEGSIVIDASIDSAGRAGEIQRHGSKWENVKNNLRRIATEAPHIRVTFNMIQTVLTVNNIKQSILELEEIFTREHLVKHLRIRPSYHPEWLDIRLLLKEQIDMESIDNLQEMGYNVFELKNHIDNYNELTSTPENIRQAISSLYNLNKFYEAMKDKKGIDFGEVIPNFEKIKTRLDGYT